ncbi:hypothetical protein M1271_01855 [Patescibacteria group bacterium]|nr:hypothetical protein [Patescibacteria group bacterium]MCL5798290.1 hypothetical protein [Patescibacteria group bacterium]
MDNDKTYQLLVDKMHEVAAIPTQEVGNFTIAYKKLVPFLKYYPWKSAIILSFISVSLLYLIFGTFLVKVASMLQFGF